MTPPPLKLLEPLTPILARATTEPEGFWLRYGRKVYGFVSKAT